MLFLKSRFAQAAANSFTPRPGFSQAISRNSGRTPTAYTCFRHTCFMKRKEVVESTDEDMVYETLIQRFEQPVFNIVSRLIDNQSETAGVVEKVFREIFRNVGTFRGEGTLKNWIYRIAVSAVREHEGWSRWKWRRKGGPDREPQTQALIEESLSTMNPKLREALVLREIEGLSYEEIAEILGVSQDTVRSRMARAREALTKHLAGRIVPSAIAPSALRGWSAALRQNFVSPRRNNLLDCTGRAIPVTPVRPRRSVPPRSLGPIS
jgi:RNA polymerase sigma-70 factor, ECF subfamily